jgi:hypothetical protein
MNTALGRKPPERKSTLNNRRGRQDSSLLSFGDFINFYFEAPAFSPAAVHPQQHLRPVLSVGTASASVKLQDGITFVILTGKETL